MSELRHDPLTDRWVVVAPERALLPSLLKAPPARSGADGPCPLCPGHEALTPPEMHAVRPTDSARDTPGWRVRVIPSRTPALRVEEELRREAEGFYDRVSGVGAHELVVLSPRHDATLAGLSEAELLEVLRALQLRVQDLSKDTRLESVSIEASGGNWGGSSLEHLHAQLLAWPLVAPPLASELARCEAHFARTRRCLTCDLLRHERTAGVRVVGENDSAVVLAPWASQVPFECWVLPRQHRSHLEDEERGVLRGVAAALRAVAQRQEVSLDGAPLRLALVSGPLRTGPLAALHWRIELRPQTAAARPDAGGVAINPVAPETAAAFLRDAGRAAT